MVRVLAILCFSVAVLASFKGLYKLTDKFRVYKIVPEASLNANLNTSSFDLKGSVQGALDQKYHYLGKGRQLFAFVSQDGKYVLKFFRIDKLKPRFWSQVSPWGQKHIESKKKKQMNWTRSFQLAFDKLKEETGMLALHLKQTADLNQRVKLIDSIGREHIVDLDQVYFILQEKCDLLIPTLQDIQDKDRMTQIIDSFLKVTLSRYQNSIDNQTRRCLDNIGVKDNRVIEFDMGEFIEKKNQWGSLEDYRENYMKFTDVLLNWLSEEKPEYVPLLKERRTKILSSMTTQPGQSQTSDQTKLNQS